MNEAGFVYLSLKLADRLFGKSLEALDGDELRRVNVVAARQYEIETLILTTPEAANVALPPTSIDANLMEIRARYGDGGDGDDYRADLDRLGLNESALRQAIRRDRVVEAVLERVAAQATAVSDTEIEIFWLMHKDRFRRAETRLLRHILVTIDEGSAGSERRVAYDKVQTIRLRVLKSSKRFAEQALKHSECPTAMNGGLLGNVPRGQLYPELEAAAFSMSEDSLSEIVETELGFHLLYCEAIQAERQLQLDEASPTIRERIERQRRDSYRKSWIKALLRREKAAVA
ncbi:MAG TPA: nitrogen fixation protein NifM [Rhodocyclaceae bacterium]|nr:nitrogen fixation protein NifM [Rhodocyclaceae bacterium]